MPGGFLNQQQGPDVSVGPATGPTPNGGGGSAPSPGQGAPAPTIEDHANDPNTVPDSGMEQEASPEEQAAYNDFVNKCYLLVYPKGANGKAAPNPGILKLLDDDPKDLVAILGQEVGQDFNPVIALAATATIVVLEVVQQAGADKPDDEIILHGGKEIIEDLAHLAEVAKIHTYTEDELNQAMLHAVNLYRVTATAKGMVDEQALNEEFAQILNAQENGTLNKILPGIERYDNGAARA